MKPFAQALALFLGVLLLALLAATPSSATCHSTGGKKYCKNGYWWKCERCGSEYCEILQAGDGRCLRDDEPFEVSGLRQVLRPAANMSPRLRPDN